MSDAVRLVPRHQGETKRDRFLRLGEARTNKILHGLDQIGNLSAASYEYGAAEVERIIAALRARVDEVERRLRRRKPEKVEFAFARGKP